MTTGMFPQEIILGFKEDKKIQEVKIVSSGSESDRVGRN